MKKPTYIAFLDYTTAFPSVHRERLLQLLHDTGVTGKMWTHLKTRFTSVHIRVLHPGIRTSKSVEILRGLPEGSRLSPTLFGIFVADLIHTLRRKFPNSTISGTGGGLCIRGILYVDDLCLISSDPDELQQMIHECQRWSEAARLQINAEKSKIMVFHEAKARREGRQANYRDTTARRPPPFHILSRFPQPRCILLEEARFSII